VWFVTDACYSGLALTRGAAGSYDPQRYLAEVTRRKARQILTAGGADEQVADHGPNGHSIFTYTLLQGLSGAADLNGDGYVTASEVGSFVPPRVSGLSKQTPVFGSLVGSEGGDFVLQLREGQELLSDATAPPAATDPTMLDRARALLAAENDELKRQLAAMRAQLDRFAASRGAAPADPKADAARLHTLGLQAYREGRLAEAVEALSKAADLDPENVEIVNNLGYLRQKLGDHAAALPLFERAVKLDPERAVAYVNLGDSLAALGRASEAAAAYRRYLELFPTSPRRAAITAWLTAHP
jgi:tetratricopeptide (TPR) repeat protein